MNKLLIILMLAVSASALSWDGHPSGKISSLQVTGDHNMGFRVSMNDLNGNVLKLCGDNHNFAYLKRSDSNFDVYVSLLMAAKFSQANVTIYSNYDETSTNYCRIGHVTVD